MIAAPSSANRAARFKLVEAVEHRLPRRSHNSQRFPLAGLLAPPIPRVDRLIPSANHGRALAKGKGLTVETTMVTEITPEARAAARREKARLRSERWRRAHGIGRASPLSGRGLRKGSAGQLWYRRRKQARDAAIRKAIFDRAEALAAALQRDLAACAVHNAECGAILAELVAFAPGSHFLRI
jgi:hypothetical protein